VLSRKVFAAGLASLLSLGVALAADSHEKGTIIVSKDSKHKTYSLKAGLKIYQLDNCGDFQDGQEVEFVVRENKVYIAHSGAKDYKCSIESTTVSADPKTLPTLNDAEPVYLKGTILGYSVRRDMSVTGGGGSPGGAAFPVGSSARKAKVYELQGPELIYQVDYCGAFQAGQFTPGQVVEFRVSAGEGRLYIRHDGKKEYSCQLEGTRRPDAAAKDTAKTAGAPGASPAAAPVPATARFSIVSAPDGADIEIDGNFVGNTPSDLEVAPGDHAVLVKKSGYKDWERKLKVVAGSNVRLTAELEKATP
jgi:hypothetical protein